MYDNAIIGGYTILDDYRCWEEVIRALNERKISLDLVE